MWKQKNSENGITLVALVVTVIVLIILSAVSISLVLGNHGLLKMARNGRDNYLIAANEEQAALDQLEEEWDELINENGNKKAVPGLYYADRDEVIMTWEELVTPSNKMLIDNDGVLSKSDFDISNVIDKKENAVGSNLVKLVVDKSITSIGNMSGLPQISEIELPNTITAVNEGAFANCSSLKKATIQSGTIAGGAFASCNSLKEVIFGDGVTTLQSGLFYGTFGIEKLIIGDGVTEIPTSFLSGGGSRYIKELKFGKNIEKIGDHAFDAGLENITEIVLPEKIKTIGYRAFADSTGIEKINFPEGLESIGEDAFDECYSLKSITLPSSLRELKSQAFYGCYGLEEVTILNGLTTIPNLVFNGCSKLKSIRIPISITNIGESNFNNSYDLQDVYYAGTQAQWDNISIGNYNGYLQSATLNENS